MRLSFSLRAQVNHYFPLSIGIFFSSFSHRGFSSREPALRALSDSFSPMTHSFSVNFALVGRVDCRTGCVSLPRRSFPRPFESFSRPFYRGCAGGKLLDFSRLVSLAVLYSYAINLKAVHSPLSACIPSSPTSRL